MPSLPELQREFSAAVFDDAPFPPSWVRSNGLSADRRLAIYRNNTFLGLTEALRGGFPVVNRLVGAEFFDALSRHFIAERPPRSSCLLDYGAEFAESIEGFEPATPLPYLPDVARLEWAWHEAFHAAEAPSFGLANLAALPPELHAELRLRLHPTARLLSSAWPVLRIFLVNQADCAGVPDIELYRETGCRVLILRDGAEVVLHPLSAGELACLNRLAVGGDLEAADEGARRVEPGFDLTASLARLIQLNAFTLPHSIQTGEQP